MSQEKSKQLTNDNSKEQQQQQHKQQPQSNNPQHIYSIYNRDDVHSLLQKPYCRTPKPNKLKVNYSVGNTLSDKHCFGINSLAYDINSNTLYSSGRDSTIKSWSINYKNNVNNNNNNNNNHKEEKEEEEEEEKEEKEENENSIKDSIYSSVKFKKSFEGHTDWVNDIFFDSKDNLLVSCSSDNTIKIWNTECNDSENLLIKNITKHDDYVKVLAYAPFINQFASSGLDSHIMLWDLNTCKKTLNLINNNSNNDLPILNQTNQQQTTINLKSSIDDLNSSSNSVNDGVGGIIGSGKDQNNTSNDTNTSGTGTISSPMFKNSILIGKAGGEGISIYSLAITKDASLVLSGSTERAIRAWDCKSGQKIFKLKGHTENIRSILLNDDNTQCLSASSDGTVRLWDIGQRSCIHVFEDYNDSSVWTLSATPNFSHFYAGTRDGEIYRSDLKSKITRKLTKESSSILKILNNDQIDDSIWLTTSDDSFIKNYRIKHSNGSGDEDDEEKKNRDFSDGSTVELCENYIIKGRPGIILAQILNNKTQILTKDSSKNVMLWDITKGLMISEFGQIDFEKKFEEINPIVSIPKWFSVDTKTGSIYITLEPPQCFQADCYLENISLPCDLSSVATNIYGNIGEFIITNLFSTYLEKKKSLNNSSNNIINSPFELPKSTEIIIFENSHDIKYRCRIDEFKGTEQQIDVIPQWVFEFLEGSPNNAQKSKTKPQIKVTLIPNPNDERLRANQLTSKPTSANLASCIPIRKLCHLIISSFKIEPFGIPPDEYIEVLCNSKIVPLSYTLATVKSFLWKNLDQELTLTYQIKSMWSDDAIIKYKSSAKKINNNAISNNNNNNSPNLKSSKPKKDNEELVNNNSDTNVQKSSHSSMVYSNINK